MNSTSSSAEELLEVINLIKGFRFQCKSGNCANTLCSKLQEENWNSIL